VAGVLRAGTAERAPFPAEAGLLISHPAPVTRRGSTRCLRCGSVSAPQQSGLLRGPAAVEPWNAARRDFALDLWGTRVGLRVGVPKPVLSASVTSIRKWGLLAHT